ncbi:MAG: lipocalin-like domain-containing protein [Candidatus Nanopelagicales bacterium]
MTEHDIPVTTALRQQFADEGAQQCRDLGLDEHHVAPWEDGFRTADEAHAFEWWYFDAQFDDGSNLVVTFSTKPHTHPEGPLLPQLLVIHRTADGTSTKRTISYAAEDFRAASGRDATCDVAIGPNTVTGDLATYDLHVETDDLAVDLRIERKAPSWRPSSGYSYFTKDNSKYLAWVVPIPYGTASGTVTPKGAEPQQVNGFAYHDHNWGNALMGDNLDHWYWGRARVGDYSVIYVQMTTAKVFGLGGIHLPVWFLAKGDDVVTDDGLSLTLELGPTTEGPGGQDYPTALTWRWRRDAANDAEGDPDGYGEITLTVDDVTLIEVLDMTEDMPEWKRRVTHLFKNPLYYDFDAHARLDVDYRGVRETVTGRTLFEKMMFR